jgi:lactoylglutathione lyase
MKFKMYHNNINVLDLSRSLEFYEEALGLTVVREIDDPEGSYKLRFLANGESEHQLELTWLKERKEPYNLGDNEFHLAFQTDDYEAAYAKHKKMGVICYDNEKMGIYFISDPDGYWLEIVPKRGEKI